MISALVCLLFVASHADGIATTAPGPVPGCIPTEQAPAALNAGGLGGLGNVPGVGCLLNTLTELPGDVTNVGSVVSAAVRTADNILGQKGGDANCGPLGLGCVG